MLKEFIERQQAEWKNMAEDAVRFEFELFKSEAVRVQYALVQEAINDLARLIALPK